MKRRVFIKSSATAALFPFFLNAFAGCNSSSENRKKILVMIQLNGGNDGLNTLIPLDKYDKLSYARPNLLIPENKVLKLKGTSITGLHPSLKGIRDLYDNDLIKFVQGVGYENPDYSHFRSTDIWLTGSESTKVLYTGWMARYLETQYKNYPIGFPSTAHPDPPAVKIGETGTFLFQGNEMDMSIVIDPASGFNPPEVETSEKTSNTLAGKEVESIRNILLQTLRYSGTVNKALNSSCTHSKLYPEKGINLLADQLKMVAKMIYGGLGTSVYLVELKGFDTHDTQVDAKDTTKGAHADLLSKLSEAITCFWDDIVRMGKEKEVVGMTFSEFGRRIISNASYGTDHGSSQPLLFFGSSIDAGIIGDNPSIPDNVGVNDNLEMQFDYRSIYSSVLKNWLFTPSNELNKILLGNFPEVKIFK